MRFQERILFTCLSRWESKIWNEKMGIA